MKDKSWLTEQRKTLNKATEQWPNWTKKLKQAEEQKDQRKIALSQEKEKSKVTDPKQMEQP